MAAIILMVSKNTNNPKMKTFFEVIDPYIESQGWELIDNIPRTYFNYNNISPTKVRSLITTIKNTDGYNAIFKDLLYSHNLTKG